MSAMKISPTLILALLGSLAATGCLNADFKTTQICAITPDQIPGVPAGLTDSVSFTTNLDLSGLPNLNHSGLSGTLLMQQIQLSSSGLPQGLGWVQAVDATVLGGSEDLKLTCTYTAPANPPASLNSIVVPCSGPNIFQSIQTSNQLSLKITLTSTSLPTSGWTADVGACFSAEIMVDYTKL